MRWGLIIYFVIGVFVAAGVIGNEHNYFGQLDNIEEILELILAVVLWPLVLIGVDINLGGDGGGGDKGGADKGGGGKGK